MSRGSGISIGVGGGSGGYYGGGAAAGVSAIFRSAASAHQIIMTELAGAYPAPLGCHRRSGKAAPRWRPAPTPSWARRSRPGPAGAALFRTSPESRVALSGFDDSLSDVRHSMAATFAWSPGWRPNRPRNRSRHQSDFYQWFYFRLTGAAAARSSSDPELRRRGLSARLGQLSGLHVATTARNGCGSTAIIRTGC
jgi:hypothetical protein